MKVVASAGSGAKQWCWPSAGQRGARWSTSQRGNTAAATIQSCKLRQAVHELQAVQAAAAAQHRWSGITGVSLKAVWHVGGVSPPTPASCKEDKTPDPSLPWL